MTKGIGRINMQTIQFTTNGHEYTLIETGRLVDHLAEARC